MLRIKLVKTGKTNRPMWRVVVVEKTKTGKGNVADFIGNYNPQNKPKIFNLDLEKYKKWLESGAQPTDAVLRLKGKFLDKSKDYQKIVKAKVYKKKGEKKEIKEKLKGNLEEIKEETKKESAAEEKIESPVEEVKEEPVEEKVEEAVEAKEEKAE